MENHDTAFDHHDRTEFQLERLILFTDAVFAIAITLLALEIKAPEVGANPTNAAVWQAMEHLQPRFLGFSISFMLIARYWMAHHRIFRFVRAYNEQLIWLNMFFLLTIVLIPFTSGFYSEHTLSRAAFIIYCLSIVSCGLVQIGIQVYLCNSKNKLIEPADATHPDLHPFTPLVPVVGLGLALLAALFINNGAYTLLPLLMLPLIPIRQRFQKRLLGRHTRLQELRKQRARH